MLRQLAGKRGHLIDEIVSHSDEHLTMQRLNKAEPAAGGSI